MNKVNNPSKPLLAPTSEDSPSRHNSAPSCQKKAEGVLPNRPRHVHSSPQVTSEIGTGNGGRSNTGENLNGLEQSACVSMRGP
ncbi:hypothetical protein HYPSUDRAFT_69711 [Hypholoma sublateritium FD-334 SS-4]|uniref:Uncharacterized protein n=1 Tax=Hypholoma sublateritium (strain FD-334 SS-4) TaxID=945553 RepID=A0A0D2PF35_HYPSF|nr:hypothetical protein HYPSUDRAFT_69711 [Hypholoma sublateritium FD-334 SS-4]